MSDVPDKIMKAAMEAYESLSVACISSRPIDFRAEDIVIVARALMAADEAATKRERAAREWQPIETAPKDDTGFLAYWPISETQWCIVTCWWKTTGAAGPGWHTVDLFDDDSERLILPTKWQPLPAPPILKGEA